MYRLGWFLGAGFGIQVWNPPVDGPFTGSNAADWTKPDLYVDLTSSLERAGFDYVLIEDTSQIDDTYKGSAEVTLRLGLWAPKNDPLPLVPLMAQRSKHIGIVPTVSTTFYPPYLAARLLTTLDHLTEGRVGVNLVTSGSVQAAQNFGFPGLLPKELRYQMANEWVDILKQLQESWAPDAVHADVAGSYYADHSKIRRLDFKGEFFNCRGPLNTIPSPQRSVPMVEAGNSPAGRDLAARHADAMIAQCMTVDDMKAFRADMHARLRSFGRQPEDLKVMFLCQPIIARTDGEAALRLEDYKKWRWSESGLEHMLWYLDHVSGLDFGSFDLDMPVSDLIAQIETLDQAVSSLAKVFKGQHGKTLREVVATRDHVVDLGLVGSPETVADRMDELMQEVGGDGFLIYLPTTRHAIAEACDGLAPVLQRRGSIRSSYDYPTFKQNLRAF